MVALGHPFVLPILGKLHLFEWDKSVSCVFDYEVA